MINDSLNSISIDEILLKLNNHSIENLFESLSKIYTINNLLVLDKNLSNLINFLTPFSKLKEIGKFDKLIWLDSEHEIETEVIGSFNGLIVIVEGSNENLNYLLKLLKLNKKLNIIIKDLTKSLIFQLNKKLNGNLAFESISNGDNVNSVKLSSTVKLFNWETNPIYANDVLTIDLPFGGLQSYFNQPLEQIYYLSNAFIKLIKNSKLFTENQKFIKLKNIYGKGNHSNLLINIIKDEKIPEFLSENLNNLEKQFYNDKLKGNTDLIVLERNLDFGSVVLNQLNYQGLIDDLFEIDLDNVTIGEEKLKLNDDLYKDLKDLNFASIGIKLNKLAKFIQQEFQQKDSLNDLNEIKKLVSNLGNLTSKQDLIKKHTHISESILNFIKYGNIVDSPSKEFKYDQFKVFLEFENDIFEIDYRAQLAHLKKFLNENFNEKIIISTIILISIINDGIKEKDLEWINYNLFENFGIKAALFLNDMIKFKLIKVVGENDFFSTLTGLKTSNSYDNTNRLNISNEDFENLGITGGENTYKSNYTLIDKFWNLHPLQEEDEVFTESASGELIDEYPNPSFALPATTVPLLYRLVESLYFRDFLKYKPVNNLSKRPNWDNLGLDNMFKGKTVDINLCDRSNEKGQLPSASEEYIILVLIGGITRCEISCLKYLQQKLNKLNKNKKIIVLTSGIVNGNKLFTFFKQL